MKDKPEVVPQERVTVRGEDCLELKVGLTKEVYDQVKRVQDLLSQKKRRSVKIEEAISEMAALDRNKHDPNERANRLLCPDKVKPVKITEGRVALPAWVKHTVHQKYQSQCATLLPNGQRCPERRFLEIHHRTPLSQGGSNHPDNLIMLCSGHHKANHLKSPILNPNPAKGKWRASPGADR